MATLFDIQPQTNIDRNYPKYVLITLSDSSSNDEDPSRRLKSGLIRVSSSRELHRQDDKLRKDVGSWIPIFSKSDVNCNHTQLQMKKTSIELDNVAECFRHVQLYSKDCVIVILSDNHAQNKQLVSRFRKLPQIARIFHCASDLYLETLQQRRFLENQHFYHKILPRKLCAAPMKDLDEPMKLLLVEIFLEDLLVKIARSDEAKQDFIRYCRRVYHDKPNRLEQINMFENDYDKKDAIYWYTRSGSFIFRIVSKTCASLDIEGLFNIRFILCDVYHQVKELYEQQRHLLREDFLEVHRGVFLQKYDLDRLSNKVELFVARPFLSTSTDQSVACAYCAKISNNTELVSVMITMKIDPAQIESNPIARIHEVSAHADEREVILSKRFVFSIDDYIEMPDESPYSYHIKLIHGEEEAGIERNLRLKYLLAIAGTSCPFLGLLGLLKMINHDQYAAKYAELMSRALQSSNPGLAKQISTTANTYNNPPTTVSVSFFCLSHLII